ncbi:hypothetical protein AGMMS49965_16290 [Bacteroidia bacterium]|nr:hypothetical protein AGMMS49965_16290 [Bacteroidia bacterium]
MKTKKFDSVKMMRDIRDGIDAEISKMSPMQILDYLKNARSDYNQAVVGL